MNKQSFFLPFVLSFLTDGNKMNFSRIQFTVILNDYKPFHFLGSYVIYLEYYRDMKGN